MPTPEVKEDFPVCTCTGRLLEGQKGRGPHPIINVDMYPQASAVGPILQKVVHASWGESKDQSDVKKEIRHSTRSEQRPSFPGGTRAKESAG